jgi:hypothetical protein
VALGLFQLAGSARGVYLAANWYRAAPVATAAGVDFRCGQRDTAPRIVHFVESLSETFEPVPSDQRMFFVAAAYSAGADQVISLMEQANERGDDPYSIASLADALPDHAVEFLVNVVDGPQNLSETTTMGSGGCDHSVSEFIAAYHVASRR